MDTLKLLFKAIEKATEFGYEFNNDWNQSLEDLREEVLQIIFENTDDSEYKLFDDVTDGTSSNIVFTLPSGNEVNVTGEFFYNKNTEKHEHTEQDLDGTIYKVVW